jgi:sugar/nucleoside kinase (ribokinase family)
MRFIEGRKYDVVGVVHALVDVLGFVNNDFLDKNGIIKGSHNLIDKERADFLSDNLRYIKSAAGGSASNTIAGIASFGAKAAVIGRVSDDEFGAVFKRDVGMSGVEFCGTTAKDGLGTGRCYIAISREDADRTMSTYLGAAVEMNASDINEKVIKDSTILYFEGYLMDKEGSREALMRAIEISHKYKHVVSMTLSDKRCVEQHRYTFQKMIEDVDVLFANEEEAKALFETTSLDKAIEECSKKCKIVTITLGKKGSVVIENGKIITVPTAANPERIVDTTGAGDLYASGFLYGLIQKMDLENCAKLGCLAAAEIIGHIGAKPEISLSSLLKYL